MLLVFIKAQLLQVEKADNLHCLYQIMTGTSYTGDCLMRVPMAMKWVMNVILIISSSSTSPSCSAKAMSHRRSLSLKPCIRCRTTTTTLVRSSTTRRRGLRRRGSISGMRKHRMVIGIHQASSLHKPTNCVQRTECGYSQIPLTVLTRHIKRLATFVFMTNQALS